MKKKIRKRNPDERLILKAKQILSKVDDFEYLSEGSESNIFYFVTEKGFDILPPGEYILKIYRNDNYYHDEKMINYYKNLSDLKLIPKIYYHSSDFMIMKYISGFRLSDLKKNLTKLEMSYDEIFEKIKQSIEKWHSLGYGHGDLNIDNIIICKNKIYFIDPVYPNNSKIFFKLDINELYTIKKYLSYL